MAHRRCHAWQLQPASAIGWVGVVGGVLGPPALWLAWASYRYDRAEADTGLTLEQVADQIAAAVRDQWTAEAGHGQPTLPVWLASATNWSMC